MPSHREGVHFEQDVYTGNEILKKLISINEWNFKFTNVEVARMITSTILSLM